MFILNTGFNLLKIKNQNSFPVSFVKDFLNMEKMQLLIDILGLLDGERITDIQTIKNNKGEIKEIIFSTHNFEITQLLIFLSKKYKIDFIYSFLEEENNIGMQIEILHNNKPLNNNPGYVQNGYILLRKKELSNEDFDLTRDDIENDEELEKKYISFEDYYLGKLSQKKYFDTKYLLYGRNSMY